MDQPARADPCRAGPIPVITDSSSQFLLNDKQLQNLSGLQQHTFIFLSCGSEDQLDWLCFKLLVRCRFAPRVFILELCSSLSSQQQHKRTSQVRYMQHQAYSSSMSPGQAQCQQSRKVCSTTLAGRTAKSRGHRPVTRRE